MSGRFPNGRRGQIMSLCAAYFPPVSALFAGAIRVTAALLIVLAAICDRPDGHARSDREVRAAAMLPVASSPTLVTLVAVPIDIVDDSVDIHQGSRSQPAYGSSARALPVARPLTDPIARTGFWLPERPPRHV